MIYSFPLFLVLPDCRIFQNKFKSEGVNKCAMVRKKFDQPIKPCS